MIGIIDYGLGNVTAIKNILNFLKANTIVTSNQEEIMNCSKIILPGVGPFDNAMNKLKKNNLDSILKDKLKDTDIKLLGICVGMQILSNYSEEGQCKGLGLIDGRIIKFDNKDHKKIPHLGWNYILNHNNINLFKNIIDPKYYFLHSFHFIINNNEINNTKTKFGDFEFISAINYKNIYGVQFHPEKSHDYGIKLFENFINL